MAFTPLGRMSLFVKCETGNMTSIVFPITNIHRLVGGPVFKTNVVSQTSGKEQRVVMRGTPVRQFTVDCYPSTPEEVAAINYFLNLVQGRFNVFRFRDWTDYYTGGTIIPGRGFAYVTADYFATGNDVSLSFPLKKTYSFGGETVRRRIYLPDEIIPMWNIDDGGWSMIPPEVLDAEDLSRGIFTFLTPPSSLTDLGWQGTFDIPCRLDTDNVEVDITTAQLAEWVSIPIIEELRPE